MSVLPRQKRRAREVIAGAALVRRWENAATTSETLGHPRERRRSASTPEVVCRNGALPENSGVEFRTVVPGVILPLLRGAVCLAVPGVGCTEASSNRSSSEGRHERCYADDELDGSRASSCFVAPLSPRLL